MKLKVKFQYVIDDSSQSRDIQTLEEISKVIKEMAQLEKSPKWSIEVITPKKKEKNK